MGDQYRYEKLNILGLCKYADFLCEGFQAMRDRNVAEIKTDDEILAALRVYIPNESTFGLFLQFLGHVPVAYSAIIIGSDLYHKRCAHVWLQYARPGADTRTLNLNITPFWAKSQGAEVAQAVNIEYSKAKSRWFRIMGMKKAYEVYEKDL